MLGVALEQEGDRETNPLKSLHDKIDKVTKTNTILLIILTVITAFAFIGVLVYTFNLFIIYKPDTVNSQDSTAIITQDFYGVKANLQDMYSVVLNDNYQKLGNNISLYAILFTVLMVCITIIMFFIQVGSSRQQKEEFAVFKETIANQRGIKASIDKSIDKSIKEKYLSQFYNLNRDNLMEILGVNPSSRDFVASIVSQMANDVTTSLNQALTAISSGKTNQHKLPDGIIKQYTDSIKGTIDKTTYLWILINKLYLDDMDSVERACSELQHLKLENYLKKSIIIQLNQLISKLEMMLGTEEVNSEFYQKHRYEPAFRKLLLFKDLRNALATATE